MVNVHRGDHRHVSVNDVDGIQSPAQPHFKHCKVQTGLLEDPQRAQRAVFEIGERRVATRVFHRIETGHQRGVIGVHAINAHALVVAQQMRRGVRAHLPAGSARDGFDEGHRRAFAVGTADHDGVFARLPQLQARRYFAHAVQPHRDGLRVLLFNMGEPLLKRGGTDGRHAKALWIKVPARVGSSALRAGKAHMIQRRRGQPGTLPCRQSRCRNARFERNAGTDVAGELSRAHALASALARHPLLRT